VNPNYPFVAEHRCEYCHAPEVIFNIAFEVDHIVAVGRDGTDQPSSWALACRMCNLRKSDVTHATDPTTGQNVPLFNPREQTWEDHFEVSQEAPFRVTGKTPIGRATEDHLQMNSTLQLAARDQWVTLGLFP
jgi:hypothetical protein